MNVTLRRLALMGSAAAIATVGLSVPASAAEPTYVMPFEAGVACEFPLTIELWGEGSQVYREFTDKDGTVIRSLQAGTGFAITYRNEDTKEFMSTKSNGAVSHTRYNADKSSITQMTGHTVLIMYLTDVPAGPSTTLYTGQVTIHNSPADANGFYVTTLVKETGKKVDICAALS